MTPPGRALAGWWRQLASLAPVRLWFADLTVFRLEALARRTRVAPLPPVSRLLLNALTVFPSSPPERMARRLGLTAPVLRGLLADLRDADFARHNADGVWHPTPAGSAAAAAGTFTDVDLARESFCFAADSLMFLPLTATGTPVETDAPPGLLDAIGDCATRPAEWKQSHGFPTDVTAVLDATAETNDAPRWQRVPVCQAERVLLAIVELRGGSVLGFTVTPENWMLTPEPALRLATADALPGLTEPPVETWRQAWREWCQPVRSASPDDVASATLERNAHHLRVRVAPRLLEKLKVSRPEAFRGDGWMLAGDGPVRAAAEVELSAV
jgi:hypothetical protein